MAGKSLRQTAQGIANQLGARFGRVNEAQATAKVQKWATIIAKELSSRLPDLYMPGTPRVYQRTGNLLNSVEINASGSGYAARATVGFKSYPSQWLFKGRPGPYDVLDLLEFGYSVKANVPWRHVPYCGHRPGEFMMEKVYNSLVGFAASEGVTLTYNRQ